MTDDDLTRLEQLAREACGTEEWCGNWSPNGMPDEPLLWPVSYASRGYPSDYESGLVCDATTEQFADYIAAASPSKVLALLVRLREAETRRDQAFEDAAEGHERMHECVDCDEGRIAGIHAMLKAQHARTRAALVERVRQFRISDMLMAALGRGEEAHVSEK